MIYGTDYIAKVDSLKEALDRLLPMTKKDQNRLERKISLEFNYNSNHIEGNTLTYGQTELLLFFDQGSGDLNASDLEEMKAHNVALKLVTKYAQEKDRKLTSVDIRELNQIILVRPYWKEAVTLHGDAGSKEIIPGQYKTTPNSVRLRNGEVHEYTAPEETPAAMSDLLDWYHKSMDIMHPVQLAAELHYRFVCIHPFDDGNGRVARLLMNYVLLKFGYPLAIIKSQDKEGYLQALRKADVGNMNSIVEYIEKSLLWSLELSIKCAKGESIEEESDIDKEITLLKREKLAGPQILKSSKVSLKLYHEVEDVLWKPVVLEVNKLAEFFHDMKGEILVDDRAKEQDQNERKNDEIKESIKDADFENLNRITWKYTLRALKPTLDKVDLVIKSQLQVFDRQYKIDLYVEVVNVSDGFGQHRESISCLKIENPYSVKLDQEEIKTGKNEMMKFILMIIKNDGQIKR